MTRINRGTLLTAALMFAVGCGDTMTTTDGGNGCSTDSNCASGKVCHPVLKECVQSCTGSSDCPAAEKTCAKFDGTAATTASPGFCQCSTDALCANSIPGNVCMTATKICSAKCTATSGCPSGSTCNTTTGQCSGATTDAGTTDAGMTTDAGVTCNPNNTQPDICGQGSVCTSANTCETVVDGTCSNIASAKNPAAPTMARPAYVAGTSTGAVIFNVVDEATNDDAFCGAGTTAFTVTVYAYAPQGMTFPATKSALPGFYYFNAAGTPTDATASIRPSDYTQIDGGKMMSAKLTLCSSSTTTTLQAGFAFSNGNGYCVSITH
jgi:hypothetical protein